MFINRLTNLSTTVLRQLPLIKTRSYQTASSNYFIAKLKENFKEAAEKDAKFQKARDQVGEQLNRTTDEFKPSLDKMKKIQEQSTPLFDQKYEEFKKRIADMNENEYLKKLKDTAGKVPGPLKFKMPTMPGMDATQFQELRDTASAAELAGGSIFGIMDIAPSYKRPKFGPRKRRPDWLIDTEIEADTDTTTVTTHKDSVWSEKVDAFKNSNLGQKFANFQGKMEDSDSMFIRGGRMFLWKIKEGIQLNAETGHVVSVIVRIEPNFTIAHFCEFLDADILPNILEASSLGDEEIVEDWCTEKAGSVLLFNKKSAAKQGLSYQKHIYSLSNIDFLDASMDEDTDTPTIMISCQTQEIVAVIDKTGICVDGSLDKPFQNNYVWVFSRDMNEPDPRAAWRVLEVQSQAKQLSF